MLTADHGATYGENFHGKTTRAPATATGTTRRPASGTRRVRADPTEHRLYNQPSPALQPLIATGNIQFSYQSTAIEAWLIDHSVTKMKEGAAAMLKTPGVTAALLARR